jgi:pilus assembly protein CpaE
MSLRGYLLTTDDPAWPDRLRSSLGAAADGLIGTADPAALRRHLQNLDALMPQKGTGPAVVILGHDIDLDAALALAAELDVHAPEVSIVLLGSPTPETLPRAMHAGITDILDPAKPDDEIRSVLGRAAERASRREVALHPTPPERRAGRVIVVLSPKGGCGKTTVATNLAVLLSSGAADETLLIDADLQFGDVANVMGLMPDHDLYEATTGPAESMRLKSLLMPHSSGLFVLAAPDDPALGERVPSEGLAEAVRVLSEEFRFVVIDTPSGIPESTLAVAELATDLVFVASMDVPTVRQMRKELEALDAIGLVHARRHLVLNRADARVGLAIRDVEAAIRMEADVTLPSSRDVPISTNQGTPLVISHPRSAITKQLTGFVRRFAPEQAARTKSVFHRD